jgi:hypothetical protein
MMDESCETGNKGSWVTVSVYKGAIPNPFGHVSIQVKGMADPMGFYPADRPSFAALTDFVRGLLKQDQATPIESITIAISATQTQQISDYIKKMADHPTPYKPLARSCATFVDDALHAGDVATSGPGVGSSGGVLTPRGLLKMLEILYVTGFAAQKP